MAIHYLKAKPESFRPMVANKKTSIVRKNDRSFQIGDQIRLREWKHDGYTGKELWLIITWISHYQQKEGYVVLDTKKNHKKKREKERKKNE